MLTLERIVAAQRAAQLAQQRRPAAEPDPPPCPSSRQVWQDHWRRQLRRAALMAAEKAAVDAKDRRIMLVDRQPTPGVQYLDAADMTARPATRAADRRDYLEPDIGKPRPVNVRRNPLTSQHYTASDQTVGARWLWEQRLKLQDPKRIRFRPEVRAQARLLELLRAPVNQEPDPVADKALAVKIEASKAKQRARQARYAARQRAELKARLQQG